MFANYDIHTYNNLHGASLQLICGVPENVHWLNQELPNSFSQHIVFISWILAICSTIYYSTVHLLPEKNRVADIYKMISDVKSWTASLCLSLIILFKITCCSNCSSFVTSNSALILFFTRKSSKTSSMNIFVILLIFEK